MGTAPGAAIIQVSVHNRALQNTFLKKFEKSVDKTSPFVYTNEAVAESGGGTLKTS